jgi:hypothetical protein
MARSSQHSTARPGRAAWSLAERQHDVITRGQLRALGFGREAIQHRIEIGRLHPVRRGVYAVGRRTLSREGHWMAAVLVCGDGPSGCVAGSGGGACLSHGSAAALLGIGLEMRGLIEVSVRSRLDRRHSGIQVHRRSGMGNEDVGLCKGIPVTSPAQTIIDLSARQDRMTVERMIDEADRLDLITHRSSGPRSTATVVSEASRVCAPGSTGAPSGSRARASSASSCRW